MLARALFLAVLGVGLDARADEPPSAPSPPSSSTTTVRTHGARDVTHDDRRTRSTDIEATANPEEAIGALAGTALVRDGGPLAPSRVVVRGLSGPRLAVDVDGLALGDTLDGSIDTTSLPLFATSMLSAATGANEDAVGGTLHLTLEHGDAPLVRARIGAGTLATARGSLLVASPLQDGSVVGGVELGTTAGDFAFLPTGGAPTTIDTPLVRTNNDQRRATALVRVESGDHPLSCELLALGTAHEGGIPGFATAPTDGLRGTTLHGAVRGAVHVRAGPWRLGIDGAVRASDRSTMDARSTAPDAIRTLAMTTSLRAELRDVVEGLRLDARLGANHGRVLQLEVPTRTGFAASAGAAWEGLDRLLRMDGHANVDGLTDVGVLWGGDFGIEVGERAGLTGAAHIVRHSRAPTLDELYAPRGLVLGNAALRAETASDVELALRFAPGRVLSARATAFGGLLDDAILYLNRNAFEIEPVNTGPAWRAGIEGHLVVTPNERLGLDLVMNGLVSRVAATDAPLPLAPAFSSWLALRVGAVDSFHATSTVRHRGPAASSQFGTLTAPAYTTLDVIAAMPFGDHLSLSFALTNLFDEKRARDANLMPLAGRQLFVSLEVRS